MRDTILVHGLWMPALAMAPLAARLARAGFRCHLFRYTGRSLAPESHAERLVRFARERAPDGAHVVAHSLGGLVTLRALDVDRALRVGRVVLLGAPVQGCLAGERLASFRIGRWLLGASQVLWREPSRASRPAASWRRPEALGVVAGTLPLGLGRVIARLPGPSDGVVRVEETSVPGMSERILLPVNHSGLIASARVAAQVIAFLRTGRFACNAQRS
jgi:pimeloyl-ACP methyl ester carboxylesterase